MDVSGLYLTTNNNLPEVSIDTQGINLKKGARVSFNTYFNSVYESFLVKYTCLTELFYRLKMKGDFHVYVYREETGSTREEIGGYCLLDCSNDKDAIIPIQLKERLEETGRIYLEIVCISEQGIITESTLETQQARRQQTKLAIITCTFKKEEYVKKTVRAVLEHKLLSDEKLEIFVVDNAKTLNENDFLSNQVHLIKNRNVGGSGGFTRGLIEALDCKDEFSHFLFMDDDILLDSEIIYRLFALYSYAKYDFAIAGSMLDGLRKHILYEAGAKYGFRFSEGDKFKLIPGLFYCAPLNHDIYLSDPLNINQLLRQEEFDYGGFWFFAFPRRIVEELGLPMPFFIKVDDMEFGMRIKKSNLFDLVAFPSIAVWHDPFYAKPVKWDIYYYVRNQLICNALHKNYSAISSISRLSKMFLARIFLFDYSSAEVMIEALKDYCEGLTSITEELPESKHSRILNLSKKYQDKILPLKVTSQEDFEQNIRTKKNSKNKLSLALSLLTLNGHLIPGFLIDPDKKAVIKLGTFEWTQILGKKKVWIYDLQFGVYEREMLKSVGISLFASWLKVIIPLLLNWDKIGAHWKKSFSVMTSVSFWEEYLSSPRESKSVSCISENLEATLIPNTLER